MYIQQISIFLENERGTLRNLTSLLGAKGIDLMALSVADSDSFGIVRCVVPSSQRDQAIDVLKGAGYTTHIRNIICVSVPDRPSGLADVLAMLDDAEISIEYLYSIMRGTANRALIAFRLSDPEKGVELLKANGIELFDQARLDSLNA